MVTLLDFQIQAAKLPDEDRAALVGWLLETLPQQDYDVSDEEVTQRIQDIRSGNTPTLSMEELKAAVFAGRTS